MSNTPAVPTSTDVAVPVPSNMPEGLEDTEASDLTMPIFRLDHEAGCIVNSLTNEQMPFMDVILLGRLKQRILWPQEQTNDKSQPMCRSYDFDLGMPRAETWVQSQKGNPNVTAVKLSGFTFDQVAEAEQSGEGLACANCDLKDWGKDKTPPWCNEQWTFPFVRIDEDGDPLPGVISFAKTGLKPCKAYVSGFVQAKAALYTVTTRIKAVTQQKGSVTWVVPVFQRLQDSDQVQWPLYSQTWRSIKEYLTTPRVFTSSEDPDEAAVQAATAQTATVSQPAPVVVQDPPPAQATAAPAAPASAPDPAPEPVSATPTQATAEQTDETPPPAPRAQPSSSYDADEEPF